MYVLLAALIIAFWLDYQETDIARYTVIEELVNPELHSSPKAGSELEAGWKGEPLTITKVSDLFRFVNLHTLGGPEIYEVELKRSKQQEVQDFDLF